MASEFAKRIRKMGFNNLNKNHNKWFIISHQKYDHEITIFPVFILKKIGNNMSTYITVKYFAESEFVEEPYQASEDAAGYDLFAVETKTLLPNSVDTISLDSR